MPMRGSSLHELRCTPLLERDEDDIEVAGHDRVGEDSPGFLGRVTAVYRYGVRSVTTTASATDAPKMIAAMTR